MEFIDESNNILTDESGNVLMSGDAAFSFDYSHGFIEGVNLMSVFPDMITANEFIEW